MKIAFLDRDGVINKEINYLHKITEFEYTNRCIDGLKNLIRLGYQIVIISNQAGIAKSIFSEKDYSDLNRWLLADLAAKGIPVLESLYCPHHPDGNHPEYAVRCKCRKPGTLMLEKVISKYKVDLSQSILIGDKLTDILAGERVKVGALYLVSSGHYITPEIRSRYEVQKDLYSVSNIV